MSKPKRKPVVYRYRSAVSGHYVSKAYAEANPKTTTRERVVPKVPTK